MAHGLEVRDAANAVTLTVTDRLTRLLHRQYVPPSESSNVVLADFDAASCVAFVAPRLSASLVPAITAFPHAVSWSGNTISWAPGTDTLRAAGDLFVFRYA